MTYPRTVDFLREYQSLCEKYSLHLTVDLDSLTVEEWEPAWAQEEVGDIFDHVVPQLEDIDAS